MSMSSCGVRRSHVPVLVACAAARSSRESSSRARPREDGRATAVEVRSYNRAMHENKIRPGEQTGAGSVFRRKDNWDI